MGSKNFEIQRNFSSLSPLQVSNTWSLYLHITCGVFTINIHFQLIFDYFIFVFFNISYSNLSGPSYKADFDIMQIFNVHQNLCYIKGLLQCLSVFVCFILYNLKICYLAQKLCFWTGIIFIRVYVSVCLSVSLYQNYLKNFSTDFDETWQDDF